MSGYSDEQRAKLGEIVTDVDGDVYFFTGKQPVELVGAAFARVSRSQADPRGIWLGEFSSDGLARTEDLIERVVSGYGDDSVQQLVPVQFVTNRISNLMTKIVEWPRIGMAYLEQSTRYIFFDERDADGNWQYYVPTDLSEAMRVEYCRIMDSIFEDYSAVVHAMYDYYQETKADQRGDTPKAAWKATIRAQACDAVRAMLPVATRSTVAFTGNAQSLENLIMHLWSQDLTEAHVLARKLTEQARRLPYLAPFIQRVDQPDRGLATAAYRRQVREELRDMGSFLVRRKPKGKVKPYVDLIDYSPRNESTLIVWLMYPHVGVGLRDLASDNQWIADEVVDRFIKAAIGDRMNRRHKPPRAFERAHFWWEVLDEYASYRDLQRHRMVDAWEWQHLTPYCGFRTPKDIVSAGNGLAERYDIAFARSRHLYEVLYEAGYTEEAQYATLLGHRMRYSFGTNLRELYHLIELRSQPAGHPGYRAIANEMYRQVSEVYPRLAAGMRFVNTTGETKKLTRLAGERATAMKLGEL